MSLPVLWGGGGAFLPNFQIKFPLPVLRGGGGFSAKVLVKVQIFRQSFQLIKCLHFNTLKPYFTQITTKDINNL